MNIAVLIKHVPVSNDVSVDPETHALIRSNMEGMINPSDLNAIEAGLLLREEFGGQVVAFTMGPPDAEKSLRNAIAIGCDEACLITDRQFAGGDTVATSIVLSKGIEEYGNFDLILAGSMSADGATGQVAPMVAEFMGIPHIAEASSISVDSKSSKTAYVNKKMNGKVYQLSCEMPLVVSMNYGSNEPRLATLRSKRAANKKEVTTFTNKELAIPKENIGLNGSPTIVLDSFEPEMKRKAVILEGTMEEMARKLKELIEEEKVKN